jgi:TolB protein
MRKNTLADPVTRPPGWALAEFASGNSTSAGPVTLDLIDPAGHTYPVYSWAATTQPWTLLAWSGDRSRVLLGQYYHSPVVFSQLTLATGQVTTFSLPSGATVLGYTRPDGENILVADNEGIARYNLAGVLQQSLVTSTKYTSAISSPDGLTEVVTGNGGLDVVSNSGGIIRQLPVPGAHSCSPVRWRDATTVLATCYSSTVAGPQMWLVPLSNAGASALTHAPDGNGPDLGDIDAWQFPSGLYVQALGGCATTFIGLQSASGTVAAVSVPGSEGDNGVAATSGNRMLVVEKTTGCLPGSSLAWLDPATGAAQNVLPAPAHGYGVTAVIPFNANGTQP